MLAGFYVTEAITRRFSTSTKPLSEILYSGLTVRGKIFSNRTGFLMPTPSH